MQTVAPFEIDVYSHAATLTITDAFAEERKFLCSQHEGSRFAEEVDPLNSEPVTNSEANLTCFEGDKAMTVRLNRYEFTDAGSPYVITVETFRLIDPDGIFTGDEFSDISILFED